MAQTIAQKKTNRVYVSLPFRDFLLPSELVSENNCETFGLGIADSDSRFRSVATEVLRESKSSDTMGKWQLKRPIDLTQPSPAVENGMKILRNTSLSEELKNGDAHIDWGKAE